MEAHRQYVLKGPDDPKRVRVARASAHAELWDGPASKAVAAFEFVKAQLTGEKPNPRRESQNDRRYALIAHPHEPAFSA